MHLHEEIQFIGDPSDFPPCCVRRSLCEDAASSGQKEVEEKKDVYQKEDAEPLFQRIVRLWRVTGSNPGECNDILAEADL